MPPRAGPGPSPIVPQPKTKARALVGCLRGLFCCGSDAISSLTSEAAPQVEIPEVTECVKVGQAESEVRQREPHNSVDAPGLANRSQDNKLEGTSGLQISGQKPNSDFMTAVNNSGVFHDSNLLHVNRGDYGTATQGSSFSRNRDVFNVTGGKVQNVNEGSLPAVPDYRASTETAFLGEIPIELLERILNHLEPLSVLKCRTVCSSLRDLIDSSPDIQWKLELAVAGKADGGNYPLSNRRKMLEQHQRGWANLQWTHDQRLEIRSGQWELYGNVLAESNPERTRIRFRQLASHARNIEDRVWAVDVKGLQMSDFGLDPMQDLLVIAALSGQTWADNCRISILTLSTGKLHPLAKKTHTLIHTTSMEQPRLRSQTPLQICGDFLATFFESHHSSGVEIVMWNWKTGEVVMDIESADILAMTFLSERHAMFGVLESPIEPCLVVVDFIAEPPERRMLFDVENGITFRFPLFAEGVNVFNVEVRSDPVPNWKPHPELSVPFFSLLDNHLYFITIQLQTRGGVTREIQVFALRDSFLPLVQRAADQHTVVIPWQMWGPEGTRMTTSRSFHPDIWTRYVYGTRHVWTGVPLGLPAPFLFVHDFNQLALRWSKQHENDAVRSVKGEETTQRYEIVTEPHKIIDEEIFEGEVETKLAYRIRTWAVPGRARIQSVMCGEDGIVIVYGAAIGEQYLYHVLTV